MNKITEQHYDESGKWHRIGGPARAYPDGSKFWYRHGKCHRRGGSAHVYSDGVRSWYVNNRHLDAPAVLPSATHPIMELFL